MKSKQYNEINNFMNNLNEHGGRSYSRIRDLKLTGALDYFYEKNNVSDNFETILKNFVDVLNDSELDAIPFYKTAKLFKTNYINCFSKFGYELGVYLNDNLIITPNNNNSFFLFPLFFKESCKKYNIEPYASMSQDELKNIISKYINLDCKKSLNPRKDRNTIEDEELVDYIDTINSSKYEDYEKWKDNYNNFGIINDKWVKGFMSVKAEDRVFDVYDKFEGSEIIWVARDCGDSFGYDLVCANTKAKTELLFEAKSSYSTDDFTLTEGEYLTMLKAENMPNTNYIISKCLYDRNTMEELACHVYKYDAANDRLVDVEHPDYICEIQKVYVTNERGEKKPAYSCTRKKLMLGNQRVYKL